MEKLILFIAIAYLFYCIVPTFYHKWLPTKAIKYLGNKNDIALTFDDGIDSIYTNQLLDLLYQYHIKATFFIVAKTIDENGEIIKRMIKEGHTVGLHSLEHKNALFHGCFYTKKDFEMSMSIMKKHGLHIRYFRPPWGHVNLFTLKYIKKYNLDFILWNVMVGDWKKSSTTKDITERLIKKARKGSIICLHDGRGRDKAPKRTIEALESAIPCLQSRGFNFVTLEEING